tara:strand:+ start:634 stop:1569 length:936 start_codon:yes stop_codon:yes gene_type:complete
MFKINNNLIGSDNPTYIIAEISANHNQNIDIALELIRVAKESGANAIKVQTYQRDTISQQPNQAHQSIFRITNGPHYGQTLYNLYLKSYTPYEWHRILKEETNKMGMDFLASPFNIEDVDFLESLDIDMYIISPCKMNDHKLLQRVARTYKPITLSSGIISKEELIKSVSLLRRYTQEPLCMLKCTGGYLTPLNESNLVTLQDMKKNFAIQAIGLSDHTLMIEVPMAAISLGANVIEKHITLTRESNENTVHNFSLTPSEFKQMVKSIRIVEQSMGIVKYEPSHITKVNLKPYNKDLDYFNKKNINYSALL